MVSEINVRSTGKQSASWAAIVVKNMPEFASPSHSVKPEDAFAVRIVTPVHNLLTELYSRIFQIMILMLVEPVVMGKEVRSSDHLLTCANSEDGNEE